MNQPDLIVRNTVALACARVLEKASSVILSLFIARSLGASALGVYSAAIAFLGLITLAAEMGSTSFLLREVARDRDCTPAYILHFGGISLFASLAVMAVSFLAVPHLGYSADLTAGMQAITVAAAPAVLRIIQEAVFVAYQRVEFVTYSTLAGSVLSVAAGLLLLWRGYGIVSIVVVFAAVQYVTTICYFVFLNRYIATLRWDFNFRFAFRLIGQAKAFTGSSIVGGLLARPEVIILSLFRNDAQIGFYTAASRIVDMWGIISETYAKNVFPILSHAHVADRERGRLILGQSVKYLLAMSLPLMAGLFVIAGPVIRLVYGAGFEASVPVLRIMTLCIPLGFLYELLWRLLAARDQQNLMLRAQAMVAVVRLGGGYLLMAAFASVGAAVSVFSSLLIHNLLIGYYVRRDGTRLGVCRSGWRLSVAALAMGALATLLLERSALWVVIPAAAVLYAVMVLLLRALSPADFTAFRKIREGQEYGHS